MSLPIISVEGLSKRFIISHEGTERYTALRDVVTNKAKGLLQRPGKIPPLTKEDFWALKDVNFTINAGERVGIIGRNGAGKSTLLKILSRITEPTEGKITIRGSMASLLEVGTGFHPELTGRENIFLNGAILGMGRAEIRKKFDEIVAFAEVEQFLDTPVKRYSSGMYVRLAFAVAAHLEPDILIVDEVLAVGDVQFQKKCLGKMEDVSKNQGRTVLFVSHNMGVMAQFCSTAILLHKGEIHDSGEVRKMIDRYILNTKGENNIYRAGNNKEDKTIYFTEVKTVNHKNENCEDFLFDENIILRIKLKVNSYDPGTKVSVTFQNSNGDFLSTVVEDLSDHCTEHSNEAEISIKFASKVLAPNSYAFRIAVFHHNVVVYDLIEMVCPLRVLDSGTNMAIFEGINYGNFFIDYSAS